MSAPLFSADWLAAKATTNGAAYLRALAAINDCAPAEGVFYLSAYHRANEMLCEQGDLPASLIVMALWKAEEEIAEREAA